MNLIKQGRSNEIKNFREAHQQRQTEKAINYSSNDNKQYIKDAIDILENALNHYETFHSNEVLYKDFKTKYNNEYAQYLTAEKT